MMAGHSSGSTSPIPTRCLERIAILIRRPFDRPTCIASAPRLLIAATDAARVRATRACRASRAVEHRPDVLSSRAGVLAAIAVFRYRVLDPIPPSATRNRGDRDGLLIADAAGRIADLNRAPPSHRSAVPARPSQACRWPTCSRGCRLSRTGRRGSMSRWKARAAFSMTCASHRPQLSRSPDGFVVLLHGRHRRWRPGFASAEDGGSSRSRPPDFNNLLTSIIGFATLAEDDAAPGSPSKQWLAQIRRSAEHAAHPPVASCGRRPVLHPIVLDLNRAVADLQKGAAADGRRSGFDSRRRSRRCAACASGRRADPAGAHQPRRQRLRGHAGRAGS